MQTAIKVCTGMLEIQCAMSGVKPADLTTNEWALGYFFGFHEGMLQTLGIGGDRRQAYEVLAHSYVALFENPGLGAHLVNLSIRLQDNLTFEKGRMVGGTEAFDFVSKKHDPLGLVTHLRVS